MNSELLNIKYAFGKKRNKPELDMNPLKSLLRKKQKIKKQKESYNRECERIAEDWDIKGKWEDFFNDGRDIIRVYRIRSKTRHMIYFKKV